MVPYKPTILPFDQKVMFLLYKGLFSSCSDLDNYILLSVSVYVAEQVNQT